MYTLFKLFVYGFFFYLIYKAIKFFTQYLNEPDPQKKDSSSAKKSSRLKIKSEDIIDAEFEDLKPEKKDSRKA